MKSRFWLMFLLLGVPSGLVEAQQQQDSPKRVVEHIVFLAFGFCLEQVDF